MDTSFVMTRDVICVEPDLSLGQAQQLMRDWNIRHLPVLENGQLVGMLSDRDVLLHSTQQGSRIVAEKISVHEAMSPAPITCSAKTTVSNAARLMIDYRIDSLPVVDDKGNLVGLVTSTDLLMLQVQQQTNERLPFDFRTRVWGR